MKVTEMIESELIQLENELKKETEFDAHAFKNANYTITLMNMIIDENYKNIETIKEFKEIYTLKAKARKMIDKNFEHLFISQDE